jgi:hypothetical protein
MPSAGSTAIGVIITLVYLFVVRGRLDRGLLGLCMLGPIPFIQVGALAGNDVAQGLLLVECLALVLVALWLADGRFAARLAVAPFERWLIALTGAGILSLLSGLLWLDPTVPQRNVKVAVSIGQLMLYVWPISIYMVATDVATAPGWAQRFTRLMLIMATPQFVILAVPSLRPLFAWTVFFGVIASPLALTRLFDERRFWLRVALACYVVCPALEGLATDKFFLYAYVAISAGVIIWWRWSWKVVAGGVLVVTLYAMAATIANRSLNPFESLVEQESRQQSWGGEGGRDRLARDALTIWSSYPLLGVGPGNVYPYMLRYSTIATAHNQYANLLIEQGLVGIFLYVGFLVGAIRFGVRRLREPRDPREQAFVLAWFGSFIAWSLTSLTGDYMLHSIRNSGLEVFSRYFLHWVFLGSAVGVSLFSSGEGDDRVEADAEAAGPLTWQSVHAAQPIAEPLRR